jgi:ArsR family transcriptional regulator, arsenate/arsenite/antimonite-responsive transcriptional repressor
MDIATAAGRLQALANPARLRIYEILSQAGDEGMTVGSVQDLLGIRASTLSHHLKMLVLAGLVTQTRTATRLVCRPNHDAMDGLFSYLARECRRVPQRGATC